MDTRGHDKICNWQWAVY